MFGSLGVQELLVIFLVVMLVFGPRKIPEIGRTLGKALGEFRKATDDFKNTIEREVRLEELKSIRTPSMESFATPAEAVSRSAPSALAADATVTAASPATPSAAEPDSAPADGSAASASADAERTDVTAQPGDRAT